MYGRNQGGAKFKERKLFETSMEMSHLVPSITEVENGENTGNEH